MKTISPYRVKKMRERSEEFWQNLVLFILFLVFIFSLMNLLFSIRGIDQVEDKNDLPMFNSPINEKN